MPRHSALIAEHQSMRLPSKMAQKFMASVLEQRSSAINFHHNDSFGFVRRNAGLPQWRQFQLWTRRIRRPSINLPELSSEQQLQVCFWPKLTKGTAAALCIQRICSQDDPPKWPSLLVQILS